MPAPSSRNWIVHALAIADRAHDLSDGRSFVKAANEYLFGELGFRGNEEDYYNPANCCLNRVLETKRGMPITLSIVYIEIARRLAKQVSGVGLPGHFVVRYDDPAYSAIIDPFHGGAILDAQQCCQLAQVESLDAWDARCGRPPLHRHAVDQQSAGHLLCAA